MEKLVYDLGKWLLVDMDGNVQVVEDPELLQELLEELREAEEELAYNLERSLGLRP